MLDQTTKRKIDSARQILVGKVPDPKQQVDQITNALIYKFMDDMDRENEEVGLKTQFFVEEWKKYSWTKLLDNKLSGQERLDLYVQAIANMSKNPHIPQLFRDVFKGAFLPYRDPRTLSLFLKEINEFSYEHSENLGNAFEYLLSILGSQGDAGQFRTPRHIIDFIVDVVDPKKSETILDPACGTAGFLISAYKHILKQNKEKLLTPDEKLRLMNNLAGYDISPDMVKLALVNMYLHGFPEPKIHEYDTLTSEKRWDETFDVILANPPFMTPKGGIVPHNRFQIQANRAEVLFVDYIVEHLNIHGRAGVIVPEGIIFQSNNAYKSLRKMLLEKGLFAVVSLPSGVFQPYSGVKTSILFFDNARAKKTKHILFVKIHNDGFDLGSQRRAVVYNDLPLALEVLDRYKSHVDSNGTYSIGGWPEGKYSIDTHPNCQFISKEEIARDGDYNLGGDRYRQVEVKSDQKWPMVELGELCEVQNGYAFDSKKFSEEKGFPIIRIRNIKTNFTDTKFTGEYKEDYVVKNGDLLVGMDGEFNATIWNSGDALLNQRVCRIRNFEDCLKEYIFLTIRKPLKEIEANTYAVTVKHISSKQIQGIKITLSPLEVQKEIVEEIEGYQKIIDGAKQIIANWKPKIDIDPEWEKVEIEKIFQRINDQVNPQKEQGNIVYVGLENIESKTGRLIGEVDTEITKIKSLKFSFKKNDILFGKLRPNLNKVWLADRNGICSTDILVLRSINEEVLPELYSSILRSDSFNKEVLKGLKGAQLPRVGFDYVSKIKIPLLPIEIQKQLVAKIEAERKMVEGAKRLIEIYEKKIIEVLKKI